MRLTYHPKAEEELIEAALFYEARSPGLGDRFLREFDTAITQIQLSPGLCPWSTTTCDLIQCGAFPLPFITNGPTLG